MSCYKPITAWRTDDGDIIFKERGRIHSQLTIRCGRCSGCRLDHSGEWAVRCVHEAQMHRENCFLTLTFRDEYLVGKYLRGFKDGKPVYAGTLDSRTPALFLKRLREHLRRQAASENATLSLRSHIHAPDQKPKAAFKRVRFYLGAEYGTEWDRPHYHICLFGYDFQDKQYLRLSPAGARLYRSPTLEQLWPYGFSSIGSMTFESAAYTARYIMKKWSGDRAKKHYERIDLETGEIVNLKPEFNRMSRRPGLGSTWLEKYQSDVYPKGELIIRGGKKRKPPRFYDKHIKETQPLTWEDIEYHRHIQSIHHAADNTYERLAAREKVHKAQLSMLKRKL